MCFTLIFFFYFPRRGTDIHGESSDQKVTLRVPGARHHGKARRTPSGDSYGEVWSKPDSDPGLGRKEPSTDHERVGHICKCLD